MTGKYTIEVYNSRVHYFLTVKRNLTILQGNSGTGKTELIRLVTDYETNGRSSGITLKCEARCTVLTTVDWELRLGSLKHAVIFIDETAYFLKSQRFAELLRGSDNYFVIVTRDDLPELPYSVDEIYGLQNVSETSKYKSYKKVYNEMYHLYNLKITQKIDPEVVITEDTGSGFQCFEKIYPGRCESAGGKSKMYEAIRQAKDQTILAVADGAAFGCEMSRIMRFLSVNNTQCVLFAPESFEYLILASGILSVPASILEETYLYADSREYISWEEYFTAYLAEITRNTIYQYSKAVLKDPYKTKGAVEKIIGTLPEQIRPD